MNIAVTGGFGFLGRNVVEQLRRRNQEVFRAHHEDYDLTNRFEAEEFLGDADNPGVLIHCAAFVGGIEKNVQSPVRMMVDNLRMGLNVLEMAVRWGVPQVVLIGTACSYPKHFFSNFALTETDLWTGRPAEDTAPYGIAKLTLFEVAQAYARAGAFKCDLIIPTNLYGPDDNFDPETGHVIPAMVSRMTQAVNQPVKLHGDGTATRDFLHVADAARGIALAALRGTDGEPINLGSNRETTIREVAETLSYLTETPYEFTGRGPVGNQRRLLNTTRAYEVLGWQPEITLEAGLVEVVDAYEEKLRG